MAEDILLLKLLKIPVYVIKTVSKLISMATYLPNYFFILALDLFIFSKSCQSDFWKYCLSWPFRLFALNLVTCVFAAEFYAIYWVLDITDKAIWVQILAMSLALGGMLFLMRKGYLQMIAKFDPIKLKSPLEHVEEHYQFLIDVIGMILSMANVLLLSHCLHTFNYQYQPGVEYNFLSHIWKMVRKSVLYNCTFLLVKVFFRLFPWRYTNALQLVDKQQENIFRLMVLLSLLCLQTLLDLIVMASLGAFCVSHWKRKIYIEILRKTHEKYNATGSHFAFIISQLLQIMLLLPCVPFLFGRATKLIKTIAIDETKLKDHHWKQCFQIFGLTLIKIPSLWAYLWIWVFRYKLFKYQQITQKIKDKVKKHQSKQLILLECFFEQLVDSLFVPLIVFCTVLKPFNYRWILLLINIQYDLERQLIWGYFTKCIVEPFWLCCLMVASLVGGTYMPRNVFSVLRAYYLHRKTMPIGQCLKAESVYKKSSLFLLGQIKKDTPFIPFYLVERMTLLSLYDKSLSPEMSQPLFQRVLKMFYLHRTQRKPRKDHYLELFNKDSASGLLHTQFQKMRFWKFASKCERHILLVSILSHLMPKRKYLRAIESIKKGSNRSMISNQYWYRYDVSIAVLKAWLIFTVTMGVTVFGCTVLAPLTLWRLPTFIILYRRHNSKKLFFKIIFPIYKQMLIDILMVPFNLLVFTFSPIDYCRFRRMTLFSYKDTDYAYLLKSEQRKARYMWTYLFSMKAKLFFAMIQVCFIYCTFLRKSAFRAELKHQNLKLSAIVKALYLKHIFASLADILNGNFSSNYQQQNIDTTLRTVQKYAKICLLDFPYLIASGIVVLVMPWRFHYLKHAIHQMKDDQKERYQIIRILKSVFKDYLCIFLNLILLLSVVKTKKAFKLILRNYRLNFFVGFLKYSYYKELLYELKEAAYIYYSCLLVVISMAFDFPNAASVVRPLYQHYKRNREEELMRVENEKIYKNSVKQGKEANIVDKMGFNEFLTMTQYLSVKELIQFSRVSRFAYIMIEREEIWIHKWETQFSAKYENQVKGQTYKHRCINAYQMQLKLNGKDSQKMTYTTIILGLFAKHVYDSQIDLPALVRPKLPTKVQSRLFYNYKWTAFEGYGPAAELPQEENEDEDFLRITGQVRRRKFSLTNQYQFFANLFVVRPLEATAQFFNRIFAVNTWRRPKQLLFIALIVAPILSVAYLVWNYFMVWIYPTKWIGVKVILTIYIGVFIGLLISRLHMLKRQGWVTLTPFDLFNDFNLAAIFLRDSLKALYRRLKSWLTDKVYNPGKERVLAVSRFLKRWVKKIAFFVKKWSLLAYNFVVEKTKAVYNLFVDKVASPLYIFVAKKLIALKKLLVMLFWATKKFLTLIFTFIVKVVTSFYTMVSSIIKNINKLYFNILYHSRSVLTKNLGVIGEVLFTIEGLVLMMMPSICCYLFYYERWFIIVSSVHSMVLMVVGYRHLSKMTDQSYVDSKRFRQGKSHRKVKERSD